MAPFFMYLTALCPRATPYPARALTQLRSDGRRSSGGEIAFTNFNEDAVKDSGRICRISKKGRFTGHNVSHANNKTNKVWLANLHRKRLYDSESGKWVTVRVSSRILRTIDRKGLSATLRDYGMSINDLL